MKEVSMFIGILLVIGGLAQVMTGCGDNSDLIPPALNSEPNEAVRVLLDEKGLQLDMENAHSATVMGRSVHLVPLIPSGHQDARPNRKDSLESESASALLAYLDDQQLGRLFVLLEMSMSQGPEMRTSIRLTVPGREIVFCGDPSWFYPWEITADGSSLQMRNSTSSDWCSGVEFLMLMAIFCSPTLPVCGPLAFLLYCIALLSGCLAPGPFPGPW